MARPEWPWWKCTRCNKGDRGALRIEPPRGPIEVNRLYLPLIRERWLDSVSATVHTWSQTLLDHYHLHCIVTGGGLSFAGRGWKATSAHYLFPVQALSKVFRAKFRDGLKKLHANGKLSFHGALVPLSDQAVFDTLFTSLCAKPWVVYSKKPFAGPQAVLAYLSRYTHRVAIGNGRCSRWIRPPAPSFLATKIMRTKVGEKKWSSVSSSS